MTNRPYLPTEDRYDVDGFEYQYLMRPLDYEYDDEELECMQQALTCEWLIEYGFMPDPTNYDYGDYYIDEEPWFCEDKTQ